MNPCKDYPVSGPRFEPSTSQKRDRLETNREGAVRDLKKWRGWLGSAGTRSGQWTRRHNLLLHVPFTVRVGRDEWEAFRQGSASGPSCWVQDVASPSHTFTLLYFYLSRLSFALSIDLSPWLPAAIFWRVSKLIILGRGCRTVYNKGRRIDRERAVL